MKKKIIGIGFVFLFLCTSWFGIAAAEMSDWAEEEIDLALAQEMVPTVLQKDYRNQIRRYEYVLLALQIYEENHPNIQPTFESPFTDTINHQYEEEIAKAFEVGIIRGNGDGTFRPDHYITREEVASLVVNLVKVIDPYQDFSVAKKYAFSDSDQIASWAKDYISFCYQEKIMLGTGAGGSGAPTMNPKGLTTREEAILLLYRLAMSKQVYEERDYGTIPVRSTEENRLTEVTVSEKFGDTFGIEILEFLRKQSEENHIEVIGINDKQMDMLVGDSGTISLFSNGVQMTLQMLHQEQISSEIKKIFLDMISIYEEPEQISDLLLRAENDLLSDNNLVYSLKEKSYLKAGMEVINEVNRYYFYYEGLN